MQILLVVAAAAVAVFQTPSAHGRVTRSESVLVRFVFDGDTIDVATVGRVRLLGIDAPEIGRGFDTPAPFGREARARLTALVLRRWVRLEFEGAATDAYNRRLAYVLTEDGQFVNAVLVREGLARVSARTPLARLRELQACGGRSAGVPAWHLGQRADGLPAPGYTRRSKASRPPVNHVPNENAVGQATDNTQEDTVNAIPVEYASERKIRERNKLLLPVQPLADLDFRLLHRARPAHLRSLRARIRRAHGAVARRGARSARPSRACAARCLASSRGPTSSASPRIGRTRCIGASATRSRGARSSRSPS